MFEQSKKTLLKLGYSCNNNCIFCHSYPLRAYEDLDSKEVFNKFKQAKALGAETVVLSGGEPTLREDFFVLLRGAKRIGLHVGIVTNGRIFSYKNFVKKMSSFPVVCVYISLHGATAETHNKQVQTCSFPQTLEGIKNLCGMQISQTVNVVVNKNNIHELEKIVRLLRSCNFQGRLKLSLLEPKGMALSRFKELALNPAEAAREVSKIIADNKKQKGNFAIGCDGFTPCLINDYDAVKMDLFTDNFITMSEAHEKTFFPVDYSDRSFSMECEGCRLRKQCPGIYAEYMNVYSQFLAPRLETISNSFFYMPVRTFKNGNGACCPIDFNVASCDMERQLFLRQPGQGSVLYRTDTSDFTEQEILKVKQNDQLYFNATKKVRHIDYGMDLKKLTLSAMCSCCSYKMSCPCVYEVCEGNVFQDFDEKVKEAISNLRGRVCDVGCGEMRYAGVLERLIKKGGVEYTGIDPRKKTLNRKDIRVFKTTIENFENAPDYFDAVLIMRSYNHFENLQKAFSVIRKILKPRGRVLIVENTPFGLLRKSSELRPYKAKPVFEHYRNHSLSDALEFLKNDTYTLLDSRDVAQSGCNEWFLLLEKHETVND